MKRKFLQTKLALAVVLFSCLWGWLPTRAMAQIPDSDHVLMGYLGDMYEGDYQSSKYDFFAWDVSKGEQDFTVIPSLLKDTKKYGTIVTGTWVKDRFVCLTYSVEGNTSLYLSYEPLSQDIRIIGNAPVNTMVSVGYGMAYNEVTDQIFLLVPSATGSAYLFELSQTESKIRQILGSSGTELITVDGMMPSEKFVGLACNKRGEVYSVLSTNVGSGKVYRINTRNAAATQAVQMTDVKIGTTGASLAFAEDPDILYVSTYYSGDNLFEVDMKTGKSKQLTTEGKLTGVPLESLCYPRYKNGAPASAVADLRVTKNPSDYKEATFYYTVPSVDLQGKPLQGNVCIEIWKGKTENDMQKIDSVYNYKPGDKVTYTRTETEEGMYYFAFRVKTENGLYSLFSGILCPFFNVSFPYRTSFEGDDEKGVVNPMGAGWKKYENVSSGFGNTDTLVHTGKYAYGVICDSVSSLEIGSGLAVYEGAEYEVSFWTVGYGGADVIYAGRWALAPEKPLRISFGGQDTLLQLPGRYYPPEGGFEVRPYSHYTKYTFSFVAGKNGDMDLRFQTLAKNDAYMIDDLEVRQLTKPLVPAVVENLATAEGTDLEARKVVLEFTAPSKTVGEETLTALSGVSVDYSRFRNFADEEGQPSFVTEKVENLTPGAAGKTSVRTFEKEGFYYARAYAYNNKGTSPSSEILAIGYLGKGSTVTFNVKDTAKAALKDIEISLIPLFREKEDAYQVTSSAEGTASLTEVFHGKYTLQFSHELYNPYTVDVEIGKDTTISVVLTDKIFNRYPIAVKGLALESTDHETQAVTLSWRNPAVDADGNELKSLDGVAFLYSLQGAPFTAFDTVKTGLTIGLDATAVISLEEQGYYALQAVAFNEFGQSEPVEIEVGYVGEGITVDFLCSGKDEKTVKNAYITLFSLQDTVNYAKLGGEDGKVRLTGVRKGVYALFAEADYYNRLIVDSLKVGDEAEITLDEFVYTLQKPDITDLQIPTENSVSFTWSLKEDRNFVDGFESYPDFEIYTIGDYKLGGAKSKGYFGGVTWPNILEDQSYIVFNPSATSPSLGNEVYWDTHSGSKMLCSFFTVRNDDWIAHSVDGGGTLKFWAAGAQIGGADPERFVVLYSTTDDNFGNFVPVSKGQYLTTTKTWTEYSFELPANAKYFAIHCVSDDASVFKVDDLSYTLTHGSKIAAATGFELYVDGAKVATLAADKNTYTFSNLSDGKHELGLKAVYANGTSEMVTRTVTIGRQVVEPINLKVRKISGEWIFTYEMPRGEKAQYYKIFLDGEFLDNVQEQEYTFPPVDPETVHMAGVCAVNNEHFSDTVYHEFSEVANEKIESAGLNVYPNPAPFGRFVLETTCAGTLEIFSVDGRKVYTREITSGVHEINLQNEPQGAYLVTLLQENGTRKAARLLIAR